MVTFKLKDDVWQKSIILYHWGPLAPSNCHHLLNSSIAKRVLLKTSEIKIIEYFIL